MQAHLRMGQTTGTTMATLLNAFYREFLRTSLARMKPFGKPAMMELTVWIYVDSRKPIGDKDHLKVLYQRGRC
jgi:hypothetical protein